MAARRGLKDANYPIRLVKSDWLLAPCSNPHSQLEHGVHLLQHDITVLAARVESVFQDDELDIVPVCFHELCPCTFMSVKQDIQSGQNQGIARLKVADADVMIMVPGVFCWNTSSCTSCCTCANPSTTRASSNCWTGIPRPARSVVQWQPPPHSGSCHASSGRSPVHCSPRAAIARPGGQVALKPPPEGAAQGRIARRGGAGVEDRRVHIE